MTRAELLALGREVLRPADDGDVVRWLETNVTAIPDSPLPGPFRSDRTPWIAEAVRLAADPEVRLLTVLASIQSGKSLFARLLTCHIVANASGPTMVLQATDPEAKDFALRYLRPLWRHCPPVVARLKDEDMDRSTTADFDRMTLYCRGAWNESNLQRLSLRYVIGDECWLWPAGHLAEASARVTAFGWMGKRIFMSQGGLAGSEFHQLHDSTDCRDWNFKCPKCGTLQPWVWEQIRFPEEAKASGTWNLEQVSKGTTYECASCLERLPDNNATRYEANAGGTFIATKAASNSGHVGLHWNSLATMSWGELGVMMLKAKEAADVFGDEEPRRIFKQKRLAMAWAEEGGAIVKLAEASPYKMADEWEHEARITAARGKVVEQSEAKAGDLPFRTAGIDVQRGHFFMVIRSWAKTGHSRLRWFGKVETWQQLDDILRQHAVHKALVLIDSGDQTDMIYREGGARRGWKCTKGSGNLDFTVRDKNGGTAKRFFSEKQAVMVPGFPTRAQLIVFSNLVAKDILNGLRVKRLHTYAEDAPPEYVDQLNAEIRVVDRKTGRPAWVLPAGRKGDNHALDCEVLAMLCAIRWGIVGKEASAAGDLTTVEGGSDSTT
jgi:hypothetical protein